MGFGVTGQAVARALMARDDVPLVVDDRPGPDVLEAAAGMDVELVAGPDLATLERLVARAELIVPSPGVPDAHPVFGLGSESAVPVISEFDLAREWDTRPIAAVTGTDGKTTVTMLVTDMLLESGQNAVAAGNTDTPLVAAIEDPLVDVFVVEASSFRLGHTRSFTPAVATWLNFGPDHLDVHASLENYESAKSRIWDDLDADSVAVGNVGDPVVERHLRLIPEDGPRVLTFGLGGADYQVVDGLLVAEGQELLEVADLWRQLPHDIENGLAAAATALNCGAGLAAVRSVLANFDGLPHRLQFVGEAHGVRYFDDSKATAPHATLAAVSGFESVVLIAGGQNKGLDLTPLASIAPRLRGVVAIGAAASEVADVFEGRSPVRVASDMAEAVSEASAMAREGDSVLLSPGCASFDWYSSYGQRGADFACKVQRLMGEEP